MKNFDVNEWAAHFGMNVVIRFKYLFILAVIVLVAVGFIGTGKVVMDSSNEGMFSKNDDTIKKNDEFKELFGNEEFAFILIEAENVFDYEVLSYIRELDEAILADLPFVRETMSLTNIEFTEDDYGMLLTEPLIGDEIPEDRDELDEIKEKALSKEIYRNRIVTTDGKATGIAISFDIIPDEVYLKVNKNFSPLDQESWDLDKVIVQKDIFDEEDAKDNPELIKVKDARKLIAPALKTILKKHPTDVAKLSVTGIPYNDYEGDRVIIEEGKTVGLIALILAFVLLIVLFRSFVAVIGPIFLIISTMICTFGLMGYLGFPVGMSTIIIMPLILVISVSYSIHVINHFLNHFRETGKRRESLMHTFKQSLWPCFVTSITTAFGFASFAILPIKPIMHMGIACSIGVFLAYLLVIIMIPIFFSFGKDKKVSKKRAKRVESGKGFFIKWSDFVVRRAKVSAIVTIVIALILGYFSLGVRVESDMMKIMGDKIGFVNESKHIAETLGGLYSYEVMIELPEDDMAKEPGVLKTLEEINAMVSGWEDTSQTFSLGDVIKDLNTTMHESDPDYYRIPDTRALIAQYLILYEMSGGESMSDWVDYNFKSLRLSVQAKSFAGDLDEKFEQIISYGAAHFPEGTVVSIAGDIPILLRSISLLTNGQIQSVLAAFIVITLIMMLILRSVKLGLISMIPNALPIVVITGLMGILDYQIDMLTVMIIPMIIGIAVDDTVHYFVHFKQEFKKYGSYSRANRETFLHIGKAIISTSVILILGFIVFVFQDIGSLFNLAVLSAAGIFTALLADMIITPALFVFFKPFGKVEEPVESTVTTKQGELVVEES